MWLGLTKNVLRISCFWKNLRRNNPWYFLWDISFLLLHDRVCQYNKWHLCISHVKRSIRFPRVKQTFVKYVWSARENSATQNCFDQTSIEDVWNTVINAEWPETNRYPSWMALVVEGNKGGSARGLSLNYPVQWRIRCSHRYFDVIDPLKPVDTCIGELTHFRLSGAVFRPGQITVQLKRRYWMRAIATRVII